jgi:tripartite ATP-independent transporter DctP family solute receptor
MKRRDVLTGAAALALASGVSGQAAAATRFRYAHFSPTDDPNHVTSLGFAEKVKQATNGDYEVQLFPNAQLGGEVDVVEGILLGTIDMAIPGAAVLANWIPEMNVLNMPFAFRDWAHYTRIIQGPLFDRIVQAAAAKNIRVLGMLTSGARHIMSRMPVKEFADLKGRKIRTVQNPVHVATFNAFGANATAIAYPEVFSSLQTGVVDGADAANTNYFTQKFYEVAPNWAQVFWLYYSNCMIMSEAKFKRLPADRQKILTDVGRQAGVDHFKLYEASDQAIFEQLKTKGVNITYPDPAPFREAAKKIHEQFLKTDKEKELLNVILTA